MTRSLVLLATGVFWAVMMAALVRREILPFFEYQRQPSYRALFENRREPQLERRTILLATDRRGSVDSLFEPRPDGTWRTRTKFELDVRVPVLGEVPIALATEVNVDAAFRLSGFRMLTNLMGTPLRVSGTRQGDKLAMEYGGMRFPGAPAQVDFPPDRMMADGFLPYQGGLRLTVGKKWLVQTMDFSLQGLTPAVRFARVERREPKRWRGAHVPCHVVEIRKRESDELPWHTLWVDDEGTVLVEQMSFDRLMYTIVLEEKRTLTPEEAAAWPWEGAPR